MSDPDRRQAVIFPIPQIRRLRRGRGDIEGIDPAQSPLAAAEPVGHAKGQRLRFQKIHVGPPTHRSTDPILCPKPPRYPIMSELSFPALVFSANGNKRNKVEHYRFSSDAVVSPTPLGEPELQGSDLELARAAAKGDAQAFEALVDRHSAELFRIALSMSSGRADAEDICQETFVGAFRGLRGFDGRSSVKTWLIRILLRQAAKVWKKNRRRRSTTSIDAISQVNGRGENRSMLEPQARAKDHDTAMDLMEKIHHLRPDHQQVIVLREVHGMSYDQIAAALAIPRGTVESRLFRARAELRRRLKDYGV